MNPAAPAPGPCLLQPLQFPGRGRAPPPAFHVENWYWIDENDIASKRTFTFLMILFSLAETGQGVAAHVVTVPSR